MPYIEQKQRVILDQAIDDLAFALLKSDITKKEGALNYCFTRLLMQVLVGKPSYTSINAAIGVLDCVGKELYRRVAVPYEDEKIKENGDVKEYAPKLDVLKQASCDVIIQEKEEEILKEFIKWKRTQDSPPFLRPIHRDFMTPGPGGGREDTFD